MPPIVKTLNNSLWVSVSFLNFLKSILFFSHKFPEDVPNLDTPYEGSSGVDVEAVQAMKMGHSIFILKNRAK